MRKRTWRAACAVSSSRETVRPLGKSRRNPLVGSAGSLQTMSYHDTPEQPLPAMRFLDKTAKAGVKHAYAVIAVNGVGLKSVPGKVEPRDLAK